MSKNIEFEVKDKYFTNFKEACTFAIGHSISTGEAVNVDVLCYTRGAAHKFGIYDYDPDASVTTRVVIRAEDTGKVY